MSPVEHHGRSREGPEPQPRECLNSPLRGEHPATAVAREPEPPAVVLSNPPGHLLARSCPEESDAPITGAPPVVPRYDSGTRTATNPCKPQQ